MKTQKHICSVLELCFASQHRGQASIKLAKLPSCCCCLSSFPLIIAGILGHLRASCKTKQINRKILILVFFWRPRLAALIISL